MGQEETSGANDVKYFTAAAKTTDDLRLGSTATVGLC